MIQLFKALEQSSSHSYDESNLSKKIPNLSVRKNELFETILSSLAERENSNPVVVMFEKLRWAAMLHYRKLFPEAISILNEVEELANRENQLYIKGVILQYKTMFANSGLYKNNSIDFEQMGVTMVVNARSILLITQIYQHYLEISKLTKNTNLLRSYEQQQSVKKFLQSDLYTTDLSALPLSAQSFLHLSRSFVYKVLGQFEESFDAASKCWNIMNTADSDYSTRRPQEYLIGYIAFLAAALEAKSFESSKKWLPLFKHWLDEKYSNNLITTSRYYALYFSHHYLLKKAKLRISLLQEVEDFYLLHKKLLDAIVKRGLEYLLAVSYFDRKDFSKAWTYCQFILNEKSTGPRKELYEAARLIYLLILFEMKKFVELSSQCETLSGFIRKKPKVEYLLEECFTRNFKKVSSEDLTRSQVKDVLNNLKKDLKKLSKEGNLCVKHLLHLYDFEGWVKMKLQDFA